MGTLILLVFFAAFLAVLAVAPEAFIRIMLTLVWASMLGAVLFSVARAII